MELHLDPDEWARKYALTGRFAEPEEVSELIVSPIRISSVNGGQ
jgi:hypothetical protein